MYTFVCKKALCNCKMKENGVLQANVNFLFSGLTKNNGEMTMQKNGNEKCFDLQILPSYDKRYRDSRRKPSAPRTSGAG